MQSYNVAVPPLFRHATHCAVADLSYGSLEALCCAPLTVLSDCQSAVLSAAHFAGAKLSWAGVAAAGDVGAVRRERGKLASAAAESAVVAALPPNVRGFAAWVFTETAATLEDLIDWHDALKVSHLSRSG